MIKYLKKFFCQAKPTSEVFLTCHSSLTILGLCLNKCWEISQNLSHNFSTIFCSLFCLFVSLSVCLLLLLLLLFSCTSSRHFCCSLWLRNWFSSTTPAAPSAFLSVRFMRWAFRRRRRRRRHSLLQFSLCFILKCDLCILFMCFCCCCR